MRSKEVDEAINGLKDIQGYLDEDDEDSYFIDRVLNYISELEEIVNLIPTQFIHEDKVFELNKQIHAYNDVVDKLLKGE